MSHTFITSTGFNFLKRRWRGLSYLSFLTGSIFGLFFPSSTITNLASYEVSVSWSVFFVVSSLVCFIGVITGNWVIEYFGLPLLSAVFFVFSVCCFCSIGPKSYNLLMFGMVFLGVGIHLIFRHIELRHYIDK